MLGFTKKESKDLKYVVEKTAQHRSSAVSEGVGTKTAAGCVEMAIIKHLLSGATKTKNKKEEILPE